MKAGGKAIYTAEHFARLEQIRQSRAEGRMFAEIARSRTTLSGAEAANHGGRSILPRSGGTG
jgi:DNA-binding transcriptional MerR regulator